MSREEQHEDRQLIALAPYDIPPANIFTDKQSGKDFERKRYQQMDTTYCKDLLGTFIADLVLQVLSFVAQLERENLLRRQAEGIAAAKAKGVKFGRSAVTLPDDFTEIYGRWRGGELDHEQAAALCGFSVRTLYNVTVEQRAREARA